MLKWSLFELSQVNEINSQVKEMSVPSGYPDLAAIKNVTIHGKVKADDYSVKFNLHITCDLDMKCARTFKDVKVPLSFDLDLNFSDGKDADYSLENPLDLEPIIIGNILAEKPFAVYHKDSDPHEFEAKHEPHPAFQALKDLIDE